ncbi:MAG: glycosyltransferase family 4 protein [Vicinamibacterales bacterium]
MRSPIRVTAVLTHPVQYFSPWARYMAGSCPEIALTVVYATEATPEQQGIGFGRAFSWDVPLREGYDSVVVRPAQPGVSVSSDAFFGLDVPEIGDAILGTSPDVALVTGWHSASQVRTIRSLRRAGIPMLYRGDSHLDSAAPGWRRIPSRLRARTMLRQFDAWLVVGSRARTFLRARGCPDPGLIASPHAVDNDFFARTAAPWQTPDGRAQARAGLGLGPGFVVLLAGKLVEKKRPLDVVRAVARIPGATLLVAGSGPLEPAVREEAARLGAPAVFAGFRNQSEMGRIYAVADVLALASDWTETWGLVVNEALATGLPCVVSDRVGCAPDLVQRGRTGEVYPFGDVDAMARALAGVRDMAASGAPLAEACRAVAAAHDFAHATTGLVTAARAVVRNRRPIPPDTRDRVVATCAQVVHAGGLERMTFASLAALRGAGADVHCLVNDWDSRSIAELAESIDASWSVVYHRERLRRVPRSPVHLARMFYDVARGSVDLWRVVRQRHATLVFLPEAISTLRHAPALLLLRGRCAIVQRLGTAPEPGPFYRRLWGSVLARLVTRFVANSSFSAKELRACGIGAGRIVVIPNRLPAGRSDVPADVHRDPWRVIYVGQVIPEKGVSELLEAVARLAARGLPVTLDVVGRLDGWAPDEILAYRQRLRARADQPDLAGRVRFTGWQADVMPWLAAAAVHCCPSRLEMREAFGLVVLEAKLAGLPSVVSSSGHLPDLVRDGVDGIVCPHGSVGELEDALARLLTNPALREAAGREARRSLDRFSPERFDQAWAGLMADLSRTGLGEAPLSQDNRHEDALP